MKSIGRVDVDENDANLGGGVLNEGPLGVIRRPDANAITDLHAER